MADIKLDGLTVASSSGSPLKVDIYGSENNGYAQLALSSNETTQGNITWSTITGDTLNITKPSANHLIQLGVSGVYLIICNASFYLSDNERTAIITLKNGSDDSTLVSSRDSIEQADSGTTHGAATLSFISHFNNNSTIYFHYESQAGATASLHAATHASIILLRRTT